jgi:hypothetical protein
MSFPFKISWQTLCPPGQACSSSSAWRLITGRVGGSLVQEVNQADTENELAALPLTA